MKKTWLILILFGVQTFVFAQQSKIDSLLSLLKTDKSDTNKVNHLIILCGESINAKPDTALIFGNEALRLSEKINWKKGIVRSHFQLAIFYQSREDHSHSLQESLIALDALKPLEKNPAPNPLVVVLNLKLRILNSIATDYLFKADYPNSLDYDFRAMQLAEELNNKNSLATILNKIGGVYVDLGNYPKALDYCLRGLKMDEALGDTNLIASALLSIGNIYLMQEDNPKALDYYLKALKMFEEIRSNSIAPVTVMIGGAYYKMKDYPKALDYYFKGLKMGEKAGLKYLIAGANANIGLAYNDLKEYPKSLVYSFKALKMFEEIGNKEGKANTLLCIGSVYSSTKKFADAERYMLSALAIMDSIGTLHSQRECERELSELYEKLGDNKKALKYYKMSMVTKDSLFNLDKAKELTRHEMNFVFEKKELATKSEQEKKDAIALKELQKQKLQKYSFFVGTLLLFALALMLFNRYRLKRKSNKLLEEKNEVITKSFDELKKAQGQLVQSEKMASLGQLTAGVAHEINNPINFVSANITPLKRDINEIMSLLEKYLSLDQTNYQSKLAEILKFKNDIDLNYTIKEIQSLINGIEDGSKRTTEIVKGLRNFSRLDEGEFKRASMNEGIESTLLLVNNLLSKKKIEVIKSLSSIPEIKCYPGQINQVFMNLLSNAIDAIGENGKIFITTSQENDKVKISISDTGKGMTEEVKQKIFDLFFTTKDVGKGTGLGLSISYGIIENHKGKIEVESEVGKGTEFVITLPV